MHPTCPACRAIYAQRTPTAFPPCHGCRVELRADNADAAAVYVRTRNQVITSGQGHVVDVSIPAIKIVMDLLEVRDQRRCLEQVITLFHQIEDGRGD